MTEDNNGKETTMTKQPRNWRDVIDVHPAADMFPLMTPDELKATSEDIKKHGVLIPVTLWGPDALLLDGRNRLDAMALAGFPVVGEGPRRFSDNVRIKRLGEDVDPYEYVISANLHRRHLTIEQKDVLITNVLKAQPSKSNRQIAKTVGVSHPHVAAVRAELEKSGDVETVTTSIDTKGRKQPAKKKRRDVEDYIAEKKARRAERETELAQRITALPNKRYGVIYADPAWRFEPYSRETGMDRAADNHYPTMTTAEISTMDIASIIATDSILFLWATVPMLPQALDVMKAWGFAYKSHIVWDKGRAGTGFWVRNRHEFS